MKCQMCSENEADVSVTTSITALSAKGESAVEKIEELAHKKVIACVECLIRMGMLAEKHFDSNVYEDEAQFDS